MSWGHAAIVSMAYIGPLVDPEISCCAETKRKSEGTSKDFSCKDKRLLSRGETF